MANPDNSHRYFHLPRGQPDRGVVERIWVEHFLKAARFRVRNLIARKQDPPDCEAVVNGLSAGIEATELINERSAKSFERSIWHFEFSRATFHAAVQAAIAKKDGKHWIGGPYGLRILVIYTNELYLPRTHVKAWTVGHRFPTTSFDHVVFGVSYHPKYKRFRPAFRLRLAKQTMAAAKQDYP